VLAVVDGIVVSDQVAAAARVLASAVGQGVEQGQDGVFRIARKVATDRMISTVDPDARHGRGTSEHGFDGYKGHVAIDPDTEVITAVAATPGNSGHAVLVGGRRSDRSCVAVARGRLAVPAHAHTAIPAERLHVGFADDPTRALGFGPAHPRRHPPGRRPLRAGATSSTCPGAGWEATRTRMLSVVTPALGQTDAIVALRNDRGIALSPPPLDPTTMR